MTAQSDDPCEKLLALLHHKFPETHPSLPARYRKAARRWVESFNEMDRTLADAALLTYARDEKVAAVMGAGCLPPAPKWPALTIDDDIRDAASTMREMYHVAPSTAPSRRR